MDELYIHFEERTQSGMTATVRATAWNQLEKKLGIKFSDVSLLVTACTHRSYVNGTRVRNVEHNERLEYLGDSVVSLVMRHYLYTTFEETEGRMTQWCSVVVSNRSLAEVVQSLGLHRYMRVSQGESRNCGRAQERRQANFFEALVGAIYIDRGLEVASRFVLQCLLPKLEQVMSGKVAIDPISHLQQVVQACYGVLPEYRLIGTTGREHERNYTMAVSVGEKLLATGSGWSLKAARREVAERALVAELSRQKIP